MGPREFVALALAALLLAIVGIATTISDGTNRLAATNPGSVAAPPTDPSAVPDRAQAAGARPDPGAVPSLDPPSRATPDETPEDEEPGDLVAFADPGGLFDLRLPRAWTQGPTTDDFGGTRTLSFGSGSGAGTRGSPGLRIVIGENDGTISLCASCPEATVRRLDDLEALAVSSSPVHPNPPPEVHEDITLGGEPAGLERAGFSNNCLGCPDTFYHAYTIRDGRPIVLAFDYWNVRFGRITTPGGGEAPFPHAALNQVLESFRFLDAAPTTVDGTFVAPDGSFEIAMPASWEVRAGSDPSALHFGNGTIALSIRSGVVGGSVLTCDTVSPTFEQCVSVSGETLEELAAGLAVPRNADPPTMWQGPNESEMTLNGEPAMLITMIGSDFSRGMRPNSLAYVVAIHDERPFLVRAYRPDGVGIAELEGLLEAFRFR